MHVAHLHHMVSKSWCITHHADGGTLDIQSQLIQTAAYVICVALAIAAVCTT
jgi:hypothetical protein